MPWQGWKQQSKLKPATTTKPNPTTAVKPKTTFCWCSQLLHPHKHGLASEDVRIPHLRKHLSNPTPDFSYDGLLPKTALQEKEKLWTEAKSMCNLFWFCLESTFIKVHKGDFLALFLLRHSVSIEPHWKPSHPFSSRTLREFLNQLGFVCSSFTKSYLGNRESQSKTGWWVLYNAAERPFRCRSDKMCVL